MIFSFRYLKELPLFLFSLGLVAFVFYGGGCLFADSGGCYVKG